jgi:hypothetical protein
MPDAPEGNVSVAEADVTRLTEPIATIIELHGGSARDHPKRSFRLAFPKGSILTQWQWWDYDPRAAADWTAVHTTTRRLVLKASYIDGTYSRDCAVSYMLRDLGGYAPRCAYADLYLNGAYYGLFVLVERLDDNFVSDQLALPESTTMILKAEAHVGFEAGGLPGCATGSSCQMDPQNYHNQPDGEMILVSPCAAPLIPCTYTFGSYARYMQLVNSIQELGGDPAIGELYDALEPQLDLRSKFLYEYVHLVAGDNDAYSKNFLLMADVKVGMPFRLVAWDADASWHVSWNGNRRCDSGSGSFCLQLLSAREPVGYLIRDVPELRARYLETFARLFGSADDTLSLLQHLWEPFQTSLARSGAPDRDMARWSIPSFSGVSRGTFNESFARIDEVLVNRSTWFAQLFVDEEVPTPPPLPKVVVSSVNERTGAIEIAGDGGSPANVSGWSLRVGLYVHTFPAGTSIETSLVVQVPSVPAGVDVRLETNDFYAVDRHRLPAVWPDYDPCGRPLAMQTWQRVGPACDALLVDANVTLTEVVVGRSPYVEVANSDASSSHNLTGWTLEVLSPDATLTDIIEADGGSTLPASLVLDPLERQLLRLALPMDGAVVVLVAPSGHRSWIRYGPVAVTQLSVDGRFSYGADGYRRVVATPYSEESARHPTPIAISTVSLRPNNVFVRLVATGDVGNAGYRLAGAIEATIDTIRGNLTVVPPWLGELTTVATHRAGETLLVPEEIRVVRGGAYTVDRVVLDPAYIVDGVWTRPGPLPVDPNSCGCPDQAVNDTCILGNYCSEDDECLDLLSETAECVEARALAKIPPTPAPPPVKVDVVADDEETNSAGVIGAIVASVVISLCIIAVFVVHRQRTARTPNSATADARSSGVALTSDDAQLASLRSSMTNSGRPSTYGTGTQDEGMLMTF